MSEWKVELRPLGFVVVKGNQTYIGEPAIGFRKLGNDPITYVVSKHLAQHVADRLNEGFDLEVSE